MCIKDTCISANLFLVKNNKNRVITIFNVEVCSVPGPSKSFILYTCMVIYTKYVSGKLGPGGTYFKIENGDDPIFIFFTGNKFALIHVSMMYMCN